jgi:autophagy-related protein 5
VTGLRRLDLESGWNSIVEGGFRVRIAHRRESKLIDGVDTVADYDAYAQFANKTLPLPFGGASDKSSISSNPQSQQSGGGGAGGGASIGTASSAPDSAYAARAIPFKIYLPLEAPVVQDVIAPLNPDGEYGLYDRNRARVSLNSSLLVVGKPTTVKDMLSRLLPGLFPTTANDLYALAIPYLHGVELPAEAEMAWLSSCSAGGDGWLNIGIQLRE